MDSLYRPTGDSHFLDMLAKDDRDEILARSKLMVLEFGTYLYDPGQPVVSVFFPLGAVISILKLIDTDSTIEVGMVGVEGVLGPNLIAPDGTSTAIALVQGSGKALRLPLRHFESLCASSVRLRDLVHRHSAFLFRQAVQSIACTRFHGIEQRLARWLLTMADRTGQLQYPATHEFLAHMLGVRRAGVTVAVAALKRKGAIEFKPGDLRITDRLALIEAACVCYEADRESYRHAMGSSRDKCTG